MWPEICCLMRFSAPSQTIPFREETRHE
jgi:hypothetical protein